MLTLYVFFGLVFIVAGSSLAALGFMESPKDNSTLGNLPAIKWLFVSVGIFNVLLGLFLFAYILL